MPWGGEAVIVELELWPNAFIHFYHLEQPLRLPVLSCGPISGWDGVGVVWWWRLWTW